MAEPTSPLLVAARAWYEAGFCVIPSHEDGGKRPFGQWKQYQTQRPDWPTLEAWLESGRYTGIGLIMGHASGNAEMIEIEGPNLPEKLGTLFDYAKQWDDQHDLGAINLLARVYNGCAEESAGGGLHLFVRVTDGPVPGNTKLAMGDNKVITETRGEGGFVIVWPTPARTGHQPDTVYMLLPDTSPATVAHLTSEELELLHHLLAEAFGGIPTPPADTQPSTPRISTPSNGLSPFDDYRNRVTWRDILEPAGWTWHSRDNDHDYWVRPGKNPRDGHSASTIEDGPFYLFSTSVNGLPVGVGLSKGQVYAHLHHEGDLTTATRQLRADGYGDPHHETPALNPWTIDNPASDIPEEDLIRQYVLDKLPAIDWQALWDDDSEEEWIAYPLLPARRLVALYSAPKVGKSLLMLELAAGIATGREILGNPPGPPRVVLYVDFENDPRADIRERLTNMGYTPNDLANLKLLSFPTMGTLDSERGSIELMAAVHVYGAEVVVIDTVSRAIAGDENENDTWLDFYRHTGLKLKQAGVALIRLDHSGKDETKGQRGGSAKSGDVDAVWRMTRASDDLYDLVCEANRLPIAERQLTIRREEQPLRHQPVGDGRRAKRDQLLEDMASAGIPKDPGMKIQDVRALVREAGVAFRNDALNMRTWTSYCNLPAAFASPQLGSE